MALKTLVKVGEITNLSDARYCAGMGVEMLGFNLDPTADTFVTPELFGEITEWVAGVKYVGEVGNADMDSIRKVLDEYSLDLIQIDSTNEVDLSELTTPVILRSVSNDPVEVAAMLNERGGKVDYYLLEGSIDQGVIDDLAKNSPILLGSDIEVDDVDHLLQNTSITGIALKGSIEEKPGFKDYDQLADILETLELED